MKKLIFCLTLTAFAMVPALRADDAKTCDKAKSACCSEAKGASCCAKTTTARKADVNVKGATLLVSR